MIKISSISKRYHKKIPVIEDVSFNIHENGISCLLGKNGAGKSTIIEIVCQSLKPDSGEIFVCDIKSSPDKKYEINKLMGVVTQHDYLINELTGYEYMFFRGLVYGVPKHEIDLRINELVAYFFDDITDIHKMISCYSQGNRMKVRIISAFLSKPKILILDEPFANLDSISAEKLCALVKQFAATKLRCVLISSHDLLYVNKIATDILVLDNKNIVFNGTKDEFTKNGSKQIDQSFRETLQLDDPSPKQLSWLLK
ncbi:MAG: ABC transporter ATP-binding protein [Bacteroidota bacterium]